MIEPDKDRTRVDLAARVEGMINAILSSDDLFSDAYDIREGFDDDEESSDTFIAIRAEKTPGEPGTGLFDVAVTIQLNEVCAEDADALESIFSSPLEAAHYIREESVNFDLSVVSGINAIEFSGPWTRDNSINSERRRSYLLTLTCQPTELTTT